MAYNHIITFENETIFFLFIITCLATTKPPESAKTITGYVFDLPALKGKNIDAVTKSLGKPSEELKPTALEIKNHITGIKFLTRGKYILDVEYFADSKKVESYFLGEKDIVADYKPLIAIGNFD
ncbi:hypothetical protein SAMN05428975_3974 [Mucilaginibacter sp. OK268]|uniref:hypothetical protein n=1 Tax=Mucilaginibacter sp. OK268 TaxID=1881048 RepID=UPI00088F56D2|nr:hypothetical protein [Mucilaginibacter sp. OK268]SDP94688.1 hypothetical protein SAMN05428975_3974 [Mucilaginibacter sp. OK268]